MSRYRQLIVPFLIFVICSSCLYVYSNNFVDTYITPKWICFFGMTGVIGCVYGVMFDNNICDKQIFASTFLFNVLAFFITCLCVIEALYGLGQFLELTSTKGIQKIVGSYNNPAGFASSLIIGFPYAFKFFKHRNWKGFFSIISSLFVVLALFLSGSRAGILSLIFIGIAYFFIKKKYSIFKKFNIIAITIIILLVLYISKKDSADGRLFIWQRTIEIIWDSPLYGKGIGGFSANYMKYQALYFKNNPESMFSILADNIKYPFNEYLSILVQFGIIGFTILLFMIWFVVKCFLQNKSEIKTIAFLSLIGIATYSFFSYPFYYPFIWVITIINILIITKGSISLRLTLLNKYKYIIKYIILIVSVIFLRFSFVRFRAELSWKKAFDEYMNKGSKDSLIKYAQISGIFEHEPDFMYNYAVLLYNEKQFNKALNVANKCRAYCADYNLELLLGSIYLQKKMYIKSEEHLMIASYMCPVRYIPLYNLFQLYVSTCNYKKAKIYRDIILEKKIKIPSRTIDIIKNNVNIKL